MRQWALLLGGLLLWAVHFFGLYLIGEFWGDGRAERTTILLLTVIALGAAGALFVRLRRSPGDPGFERWHRSVALLGLGTAVLAILWQTLPGLIIG